MKDPNINQWKLILTIFRQSLHIVGKDPLGIMRINILVSAIFLFINYVAALLSLHISYIRHIQETILSIVVILSFAFFLGGYLYYYWSNLQGISGRVAQLYRGYRWYMAMAGYLMIHYVGYLLLIQPFFDYYDYHDTTIVIRMVSGLLLYFWLALRIFFTPLLLIDKYAGLLKAIRGSFYMTSLAPWQSKFFIAINMILALSGFILFGFGVFYSMAVATYAFINYYQHLQQIANQTKVLDQIMAS